MENSSQSLDEREKESMLAHLLRCFLCSAIGCLLLTACIQPPSAHTIPVPATAVEATAPVTETVTVDQLAGFDQQSWSATSPDGVWQIAGLTALPQASGEQYYTEMRVQRADGSVKWLPVATWSNFGLGYTTPQLVQWSPDGRYLYFTNAPVPDGCALFVNASDLQRLDLGSGEVQEVLPTNSTGSLAIAPDGKTVAYSHADEVVLRDLDTGEVRSQKVMAEEASYQLGNYVWSPDSQQVAFTIANAPCQPPTWRHSILQMDAQTLATTTLIEPDQRRFTITAWPEAAQLLLLDAEHQPWALDITSGAISQGTE